MQQRKKTEARRNPLKRVKAETVVITFLKENNIDEFKEELWQDLVYLMGSPDFNHSTSRHKVRALERYKDLCNLLDALSLSY